MSTRLTARSSPCRTSLQRRKRRRKRRSTRSPDVFAVAFLFATSLFTTADLPVHAGRLRLMVVGDAGATHSALRAGMLVVQHDHPVDAILLVGDNFYPCG